MSTLKWVAIFAFFLAAHYAPALAVVGIAAVAFGAEFTR
jgi:hypothetical protein